MIVFDYEQQKVYEQAAFPKVCKSHAPLFVFCRQAEVPALCEQWHFDESTVVDCMNIDESVRFTAFDGYDFVSLVHQESGGMENSRFNEINLYISKQYLVFVSPNPDAQSKKLAALEEKMLQAAQGYLTGAVKENGVEVLNHLYFLLFNLLLSDFSDILEAHEDRMEELSEHITVNGVAEEKVFEHIQTFRKRTYVVRKILRALSYMGLQILCNENETLAKKKLFLFRNLDTRIRKLYDFSDSVYGLSTELLYTYDSKLAQRTNDVVNKLTIITLFFGPLTVITGIYGMNFEWMPELDWRIGYPLTLGVMVLVSFIIYWIMKKKRWL